MGTIEITDKKDQTIKTYKLSKAIREVESQIFLLEIEYENEVDGETKDGINDQVIWLRALRALLGEL